jgi:hypothetical protein
MNAPISRPGRSTPSRRSHRPGTIRTESRRTRRIAVASRTAPSIVWCKQDGLPGGGKPSSRPENQISIRTQSPVGCRRDCSGWSRRQGLERRTLFPEFADRWRMQTRTETRTALGNVVWERQQVGRHCRFRWSAGGPVKWTTRTQVTVESESVPTAASTSSGRPSGPVRNCSGSGSCRVRCSADPGRRTGARATRAKERHRLLSRFRARPRSHPEVRHGAMRRHRSEWGQPHSVSWSPALSG